jgi:hypothetical protein
MKHWLLVGILLAILAPVVLAAPVNETVLEDADVQKVPWVAPPVRLTKKNILLEGNHLRLEYPCLDVKRVGKGISMIPISQVGHRYVLTSCFQKKDIQVGDIIVYDLWGVSLVVHQVVEIGEDEKGWYARTRGTNNWGADLVPVRFDWVKYIAVGVLW